MHLLWILEVCYLIGPKESLDYPKMSKKLHSLYSSYSWVLSSTFTIFYSEVSGHISSLYTYVINIIEVFHDYRISCYVIDTYIIGLNVVSTFNGCRIFTYWYMYIHIDTHIHIHMYIYAQGSNANIVDILINGPLPNCVLIYINLVFESLLCWIDINWNAIWKRFTMGMLCT